MSLSTNQIQQAIAHLESCKKPLFFFDDDQDGICSFLQLFLYKKEGRGMIVKMTPKIDSMFVRKVNEYSPDKVFILDIAVVEQDFLDEMKVPVVWIDHHSPLERRNVNYFNSRVSNYEDNHPTSYMCYQIVSHALKENDDGQHNEHRKYLWIAGIGCIADWFMPPFIDALKNEFPELIDAPYKSVGDIIYHTKLGLLIRIFSFILKGKTDEVMKCIKALAKIASPFEILNQESANGRFIYKRYEHVNKMYEPLIKELLQTIKKTNDKFVFFIYKDDKTSFTSDLSNEAIYRHPDKVILIGRERNEEMKCSIRSSKIILPPLVEKALIGLDGYGGGHEHACGLNVKTKDFDEFLKKFQSLCD